jgi:hypothetical protein
MRAASSVVPRGRGRGVGRYLVLSFALIAVVVGVGWPFLDETGRRALLIAGAVALLVQVGSFAALTTVPPGTNYFLGMWIGATLLRFSVLGGSAFLVAGVEGVDLMTALFGLAGLFTALMFLELWVILERLKRG